MSDSTKRPHYLTSDELQFDEYTLWSIKILNYVSLLLLVTEYAYTLKVDEKSDVYSFGVVLLELITGRRPVGDFGEEGLDIVQWTKRQTNWNKEGVVKILDQRASNIPVEEAMQVFFVAMLCVEEHSVERPTMREVVQMLAQAKQPNTFHMQ